MPFFQNVDNLLKFQNKSEHLKCQPFNYLVENIKMCYIIVTTWLHSFSVFAKEGILLGFYAVRHCKPGKCRYFYVTFLAPWTVAAIRNKRGRMVPWKACLSVSGLFCLSFTVAMDAVHQRNPGQGVCSSSCFHSCFFCCFSVRYQQLRSLSKSE